MPGDSIVRDRADSPQSGTEPMTHTTSGGEPGPARRLRITRSRAMSYTVPKRRGRRGPRNYLVELTGIDSSGGTFRGLGEGQPRGPRTGDAIGRSWDFLVEVARRLEGVDLDVSSPAALRADVSRLTGEFTALASEMQDTEFGDRPYHGTLLAAEVALLDLGARASGVPMADVLGRVRDTAPLAPLTLSPGMSHQAIRERLIRQSARSEQTRLLGTSDVDESLNFIATVAELNADEAVGAAGRPLWIDFNGALDPESAEGFLSGLVKLIGDGRVPSDIVVEQPVHSEYRGILEELQLGVDESLQSLGRDGIRLIVMADEAVGGLASLRSLPGRQHLRAVNVRPAQAGGLLATLEMAREVYDRDPEALVLLTRMAGASVITTTALRHLALAMPRIDSVKLGAFRERTLKLCRRDGEYVSDTHLIEDDATTDGESEESDVDSQADSAGDSGIEAGVSEYEDEVEAEEDADEDIELYTLSISDDTGLGLELINSHLIGPVVNYVTFPEPQPPTHEGRPAREYDDVEYIRPLGAYATHGHVVEREALAYGLSTRRFNKTTFLAEDGTHAPLTFRTARWPLTSVAAASIVRHKEATRILLEQAGCPVPQGRTFSGADVERALAYAARINYPVVLKPAAGSMGVGVTANIQNSDELRSALDRLRHSTMGHGEFIVEKHVRGRDYRIMVLGDEVIAAAERVPASVLGDGESTVAELILAKNAVRKANPHLGPLKLKWNATSMYEVHKLGLTADSVVPAGQRVFLNSANNLTQGGDSIEILDELHPSIIEASVEAVRAIPGLAYCGVDFLLEDHTRPLGEQEGAVCELNAVAAIPVAEYPMYGTPRPLARRFLERSAQEFDIDLAPVRADSLRLQLEIRGKVTGVGYRDWFVRRAQSYGCVGTIRNRAKRKVEVRIAGSTPAVSALVTAAILGPSRAIPTSVFASHIDEDLGEGFVVLDDDAAKGAR